MKYFLYIFIVNIRKYLYENSVLIQIYYRERNFYEEIENQIDFAVNIVRLKIGGNVREGEKYIFLIRVNFGY